MNQVMSVPQSNVTAAVIPPEFQEIASILQLDA